MKYVIVSVVVAMALIVAVVGGVGAQSNYQQFWSNVQMMYDLIVEADVTIQDDLEVAGTTTATEGVIQTINTAENVGMLPTVASATIAHNTAVTRPFTIAAGETWLIHDVLVNVTSNFNCTGDDCTLQIGNAGDANGYVDLVDAELQAAAADITGGEAGWMGEASDTKGAYLADGTHVAAAAASAEYIEFAVGGTDPAAGAATIYVIYTRID